MLGGICDKLSSVERVGTIKKLNYLQRTSGEILALTFPVLKAQL